MLRLALALAEDNPGGALTLLEEAFQKARREGDEHGAASIARHAGLLSAEEGDFGRAQRYYKAVRRDDPTGPYPYLALADVFERQKMFKDAAACFKTAEYLANEAGDVELASAAASALRRVRERLPNNERNGSETDDESE